MEASNHGVRLLNSAIIGLLPGSGVKLTPELGYFKNLEREEWIFVHSKFTNNSVSDVKLTSELTTSMNSVLLRWLPF